MDADPERRERVERLHRAYDVVLGLAELRESCGVTQARLAESLDVSRPNVSKIEGKEDLRLSTLCGYVKALGGRLEVKAVFPDHVVDLALSESSSEKSERPLLNR
jgi:DNA-binding XRE family transcriptional regulator